MVPRNILLFHAGALGDFVLTWPLAMTLGRIFPQSRVLYVTQGQKGALAEAAVGVESADIEAGWHGLFSESPALPNAASKLLAGAHTVITFLADAGDRWASNVEALAPRAKLIPLRPRPPAGYTRHASEFLLDQLDEWPTIHAGLAQMLNHIAARGIGLSRSARDHILIHPGSGSREKNWPREKYLELIHRLREDGRSVRVTLGEVEREQWPEHEIAAFAEFAEVLRPATYVDLMRELSSASAVITNDSGPGHLAGILGVPTLSLFGPTNPNVWSPLGPRVRVIRHQPITDLPVGEVIAECERL